MSEEAAVDVVVATLFAAAVLVLSVGLVWLV